MSTGCIILAAGASSRLRQPKQLLRLHGEAMLDRAIRISGQAGCAPIVVVLGASADEITRLCVLTGAERVLNPEWAEGMASSLRAGVATLAGRVDAAVVMTCDQPAVDAAHLQKLIQELPQGGGAVASSYAGRSGVPACFPAAQFAELMSLTGDQGARRLLERARSIPLTHGDLDVDTPASLARMRELYGE